MDQAANDNDSDDDDPFDPTAVMPVLTPEAIFAPVPGMPLRQVLYLRVRASDRLEERLVDGSPVLVPLPGVDVRYSVEAVFWDGWWELLYWGRELEPAKALAQRVAARYDVPIRRCDDPHPRIPGY